MSAATDNLFQRHPIISYSLARFALFLVTLVLLGLLGMRGLTLIGLAVLISGGVALILLDGLRGRYGTTVAGYFRRLNERIDEATRAEDVDDVGYPTPASDTGGAALGVSAARGDGSAIVPSDSDSSVSNEAEGDHSTR